MFYSFPCVFWNRNWWFETATKIFVFLSQGISPGYVWSDHQTNVGCGAQGRREWDEMGLVFLVNSLVLKRSFSAKGLKIDQKANDIYGSSNFGMGPFEFILTDGFSTWVMGQGLRTSQLTPWPIRNRNLGMGLSQFSCTPAKSTKSNGLSIFCVLATALFEESHRKPDWW